MYTALLKGLLEVIEDEEAFCDQLCLLLLSVWSCYISRNSLILGLFSEHHLNKLNFE